MGDAMKDKVEGKVHEVKGAVTGDKGEEIKGKAQGLKGDIEREGRHTEDVREDARDEARRHKP